jgi:LacI family transcriptional regulator
MARLTLEQIGRLAGVSRSTVSRALNDQPRVSPETRERVLQVIAETGYHPDPAARRLASRRSGIIGLVIPLAIQSLFADPFFPTLIQAISGACNARDYILSLIIFQSKEEEQALLPRITRNQLFDGVIVASSRTGDLLIAQLLANKVPFVLHGRHDDPRVSYVDADNVAGAYAAVSHLVRLGYSRIATIGGPPDSAAGADRKRGYLNALRDRGRPIDEALVASGDYSEASGFDAMQRLLPHNPDGVFVASDTMALGALRALHEAGVRVPDEVALVGFDDMPYAATATPPLTTIRQPIGRAGAMAVEILFDILRNGSTPACRTVLPTELVIRDSCGASQIG